jgi:catechol 2,3-dioxygenase-like lactoylglutathione lyase family enzyme
MDGVRALHHTGIIVSDLERSIAFYGGVLGLEMLTEPSPVFDDPELGEALGVPGAALRMVTFRVGDGILELLEYSAPPSPVDAPLPQNALGSHHVAFRVDDIAATHARLRERGVRFLSTPQAIDDGVLAGWRWAYFTDPDGITLELVEIAYERPEAERRAGVENWLARQMQTTEG